MNSTYQIEYDSLMNHAKATNPSSGYGYERHHIIPKCMGGTDDESNIVTLTYKEHIQSHILLYKMHPTNGKLASAVCAMVSLQKDKSKSRASARIAYWESLSGSDRDEYIRTSTMARAEKHLPWNTSGFPKGFVGMSKYLRLNCVKRECDDTIEKNGKLSTKKSAKLCAIILGYGTETANQCTASLAHQHQVFIYRTCSMHTVSMGWI